MFVSVAVLGGVLFAQSITYSAALGAISGDAIEAAAIRHEEERTSLTAATVARELIQSVTDGDRTRIEDILRALDDMPGIDAAALIDADGKVRHGRAGGLAESGAGPLLATALGDKRPHVQRSGDHIRVAAAVASTPRHVLLLELGTGPAIAEARAARRVLADLLGKQRRSLIATGLLVALSLLAAALFAAHLVARDLARPIAKLAADARRIGRGQRLQVAESARTDEIGELARALEDMAHDLDQTTVSRDFVDNVLQSMADMLLVVDADARVIAANRSCLETLHAPASDVIGAPLAAWIPEWKAISAEAAAAGDAPVSLRCASGDRIPVRVSSAILRAPDGRRQGQVLVMQNVAETLAAREHIERSLREKDILLREIHHRVKNNLQIISSMLRLHGDRLEAPETRAIFVESENRIRAMALIHEQLYRAEDIACIDMESYLERLTERIVQASGGGDHRVRVAVADEVREMEIDRAIPCGLIVNELVTNAVEHAFKGGTKGSIDVRLERNGDRCELAVSDDGVGLDTDPNAHTRPGSLGLRLVHALVDQLGGKFDVISGAGSTFVATLPLSTARARLQPAAEGAGA